MRIISGSLKGKSISYIKSLTTRPLKDIVKENIFNIIKHSKLLSVSLENSHVLDLYSGVGSFGLECLSRGARKVKFVEENHKVAQILKKNLAVLSLAKKSNVINNSVENFTKSNIGEKYNIFFFDPPFSDKSFIQNIKKIKEKKIFTTEHIIILHREKNTDDNLENYIDIIISRQYGRSKIIFGIFS